MSVGYWFAVVRMYGSLRRAYRRHGVLPYSRWKTWDEARYSERIRRLA